MSQALKQFISAMVRGVLAITLVVGVGFFLSIGTSMSAVAQSTTADVANPSGFPLPRFVSLRSKPINVRVGPGTRYDVAWVFVKANLPIEVIKEFDIWRKIRDIDGQEGWIHKNLLIGNRMAYIAPWIEDTAYVTLRSRKDENSNVRAKLGPKVLVSVDHCDGVHCKVSTRATSDNTTIYAGFVDQEALWGVYANEEFE